jgi:hypothetical protein
MNSRPNAFKLQDVQGSKRILWNTMYSHRCFIGLCLYFVFLFVVAPFQLRGYDTFYYWDWSRHLDISYYDGPPIIAYWIKLSTLLLGNTLFALASVAIFSTIGSCFILYKTARLFFSEKEGYEVVLFWLFSPLTTLDLLKQTTYDNPSTFFWIVTLYFCMRFIKENHIKHLYFIGLSFGLLLLSKYTGIILMPGLLCFLLSTPYRYLFKTIHFYAAVSISLLLISPIIIWNYQHHWVSFTYQLTTHLDQVHTFILFLVSFFVCINGMLLPLVNVKFNHQPSGKTRDVVQLCLSICLCFFLFYLFFAFQVKIRPLWMQPFLATSALLIPFWQHPVKKMLLLIYIISTVGISINSVFLFKKPAHFHDFEAIKSLNTQHAFLPKAVVTTDWMQARLLFFLKNKPTIYTLNSCYQSCNQYGLWSRNLDAQLRHAKEFLYIGHSDERAYLQQHGYQCKPWVMEGLLTYYCTA